MTGDGLDDDGSIVPDDARELDLDVVALRRERAAARRREIAGRLVGDPPDPLRLSMLLLGVLAVLAVASVVVVVLVAAN